MKGAISEFPPELLSRIFLNLPYKSLLSLQAVCKPSKVYVEPGLPEPYTGDYDPKSEPVRLHPAIQEATYTIGEDLSEVPIFLYDEGGVPLAEMAIANDFILIPAVTTIAINQDDPETASHYHFKAENKDGVRLIDLFKGMDKAAHRKIGNAVQYWGQSPATSAELLVDHVYYMGLHDISRKALRISAALHPGG
ncbi:hypothetical protein C8R46DRAFT_1211298 [Mycena filopes]|nr:hypothetical protein C8R46DRAFT_1211298 [Mycena filopes]